MTEIQNVILNIFMAVKQICDDNGIRYFAIGGTCLGAVRHHGFIPWDDDLDIAMPDVDFHKFMQIAPDLLPSYLELIPIGSQEHRTNMFAKIHDVRTTFIEATELPYQDSYKGIFIDIMPLCGIPESKLVRNITLASLKFARRLDIKQKTPFNSNHRFISKIIWLILYPINKILPNGIYAKLWMKIAFSHNFDNCACTGYIWAWEQKLFESSWFSAYVEMPFETTMIRCPIEWDKFLTKLFGNYIQLPPESERIPVHSGGIVDLERSYRYYQAKGVHAL